MGGSFKPEKADLSKAVQGDNSLTVSRTGAWHGWGRGGRLPSMAGAGMDSFLDSEKDLASVSDTHLASMVFTLQQILTVPEDLMLFHALAVTVPGALVLLHALAVTVSGALYC